MNKTILQILSVERGGKKSSVTVRGGSIVFDTSILPVALSNKTRGDFALHEYRIPTQNPAVLNVIYDFIEK